MVNIIQAETVGLLVGIKGEINDKVNPYLLVKQELTKKMKLKLTILHQIRYDLHLTLYNMDVYKIQSSCTRNCKIAL